MTNKIKDILFWISVVGIVLVLNILLHYHFREINSDNALIEKCHKERVDCVIFTNPNGGNDRYRIEYEDFRKTLDSPEDAIKFINKIKTFENDK